MTARKQTAPAWTPKFKVGDTVLIQATIREVDLADQVGLPYKVGFPDEGDPRWVTEESLTAWVPQVGDEVTDKSDEEEATIIGIHPKDGSLWLEGRDRCNLLCRFTRNLNEVVFVRRPAPEETTT